ncbi:DUF6273 domain-containing protein [Bacteroides acidifaciens]|uniref:DUF6273 domain-containing protein n=1 Tax=Bacteroides acidifaciens TaxID=85831 RepID=UPI0026DF1D12|nr:DUF6273 domain-containing protein [Bacteroides acidifaciens]
MIPPNKVVDFGYILLKDPANWWLRSVNAGNSYLFCIVTTGGSANNNNSGNSNGVAPDS